MKDKSMIDMAGTSMGSYDKPMMKGGYDKPMMKGSGLMMKCGVATRIYLQVKSETSQHQRQQKVCPI